MPSLKFDLSLSIDFKFVFHLRQPSELVFEQPASQGNSALTRVDITIDRKLASDMAHTELLQDPLDSERKILIAIDFGTAFTGVAWAQTARVSASVQPDLFLY